MTLVIVLLLSVITAIFSFKLLNRIQNNNIQFKCLSMSTISRSLNIEIQGTKICYDYLKSEKSSADAFPVLYLPGRYLLSTAVLTKNLLTMSAIVLYFCICEGLFSKKNEARAISIQSWCRKKDYVSTFMYVSILHNDFNV